MSIDYYDFIAWNKGNGYTISRAKHLGNDDVVHIDGKEYKSVDIENMVNEGNAIVFHDEDIEYVTDDIYEVNTLLSRSNDLGDIYGIWMQVIANSMHNFEEYIIADLDNCEFVDGMVSNLAGMQDGWYQQKDKSNLPAVKLFNKIWESHVTA